MPERPLPPPDECANCGASIPKTAKACPECGADERTGWRETSVYDGMDLPEEAWRAADATSDTSKPKGRWRIARVNDITWYYWTISIALIMLLLAGLVALGNGR